MIWAGAIEQLNDTMPDTICDNITAMAAEAQAAGVLLAICSLLPIWGPSWYPVPGYAEKKNAQIVAHQCTLARDCRGTRRASMWITTPDARCKRDAPT